MSIITTSSIDILRESSSLDSTDSASISMLEQELKEVLEMETTGEVAMNEEYVNIYVNEDNYMIEYSDVLRFANSEKCSEIEAINRIADYYNENGAEITPTNLYIMIESDQTFDEALNNAKLGNKDVQHKLSESVKSLKELKSYGVQFKKKC